MDMIGTKLGSYEIVEELGKGGMATVYRAYQPHMERYVAVKVISRAMMEEATAKERFQREARIIAKLEHPHLLPIHDFDGSHDPPYIVMRYLEGGTLKEALSGRRLPFGEITYLLRQIGSALDYAHRQGIIHRDIKPSNIMIDQEGNAFVMDFGIARMTGRDGGRGDRVGGDLTGTGTIIGTPDYMAPEQGYGTTNIGLQADIYSLGVMLFEMLTGELPFKGQSPMETMLYHLTKPVPTALAINEELPTEIDEVIARAMAKEPSDRFPSVVEFTAEVVHVLGDSVATTPSTLQEAAQESVAMVDSKRAGVQDQIEATMAEFAKERGEPMPSTSSQSTPAEQHRTVTALYADVVEYNELIEMEDGPQAARRAVRDLWALAAQIVDDHGGAVFNQSERDMLVLWGAATARENDPEQAVRASLAIKEAMGERVSNLIMDDEPMPIRIGVNTGPALIALEEETASYTASGATVNLASRLADKADGLVLMTQDTYRHVQGVFDIAEERPMRVRRPAGRSQVNIYRVNAVKPRAFRLQPRGVEGVDTEMVGRRAELEQLQKAYFNAIEDSEVQMATVSGAAGLGKSRLLYEFASWTELRPEQFFIFRGRATPAMDNRPYGLWRDVLSFRFEILDSDGADIVRQKMEDGVAELIGRDVELSHLMGHLAGFDLQGSPYLDGEAQEIADKARAAALQFFQRLVEVDPVIIQLEDLQHADDASLDLLAELINASDNLPLMVVGLARPEFYQRRSAWGRGQESHVRVDLKPLDKRDSRELAEEILKRVEELPKDLRDLLVERAEGNPYYMEELVKMMIEDRVIQKLDEDRWTVEASRLKNLRVPPTLVGLLQARFDSLLYPEKLTLQRAAVVGRVFYDKAIAALDSADSTHIDELGSILKRLNKREFIFDRETSAFEGSTEYIFGQAMMRSLILDTLLEQQVKTYHRATAQWYAAHSGERSSEYDGLIADHYEQAGEYFLAAEYLAKASKAAFNLGAYKDGINLGNRAIDLLEEIDNGAEVVQLRLDTQMSLAEVYGVLGQYESAEAVLNSAVEGARASGDRVTEANALAHLGRLAGVFLDDHATGLNYLEEALKINKELGDKAGLVFILRQMGNIEFYGDLEKGEQYLMESLRLAEELEDLDSIANGLNSLGLTTWSLGDLEKAMSHFERGRKIASQLGEEITVSMIDSNMGWLYSEMGDYEAAQKKVDEGLPTVIELNMRGLMGNYRGLQGWIACANGKYEDAQAYILQSMNHELEIEDYSSLANRLYEYAWVESKTGSVIRALEIVGLCMAHEIYQQPGLKRFVDKVFDEVRAGVPDKDVEAALARGKEMELMPVVEEILGTGS